MQVVRPVHPTSAAESNEGAGVVQPKSEETGKSFFWIVLMVFAGLALAIHPQVLKGKIPLPTEIVTNFPPWEDFHGEPKTPHAEVGDSVTMFYPWRVFQESALRQRELPLWNPSILAGTPFHAGAQSALFYPPHLLLLALQPPALWTFKLLLNLMLSGVFTALFVRSIGGSPAGAIAAGLIFSCCGFMATWQAFTSLADAAIWLPFVLWSVQRLCLVPSVGGMVVSAIAFAMPVLAGHPETGAHLVFMGSGFALCQCIGTGWRDRTVMRRLLWFSSAGLLAIGISSVQIIPTLEWLARIDNGLGAPLGATPTRQILAFLSRDILRNPNSAGLDIPESAAYVAPIVLLLAPIALLYRNRRESLYFLFAVVLALSAVYGWWPVRWVIERTPVVKGIKNGRALLLIDFSLAVLAGLGITVLSGVLPKKAALRRYVWIASGLMFVIAGIGVRMLSVSTRMHVERSRGPAATAVFLILGFILIAARISEFINARVFLFLVLSLLCVDMVTFRSRVLPFASRQEIFPPAPVFQFLKANADPDRYRVSAIDDTYPGNSEMSYGLAALAGYDIKLLSTGDLLSDFSNEATGISLNAERIVNTNDRRLDLMNLRYLVATTLNNSYKVLAGKPDRFKLVFSDHTVRVFENPRVLPRATFLTAVPGAIEVIPDDKSQLARLKDPAFDPEKSVIVPASPWKVDEMANSSQTSFRNDVSLISSRINGSTFNVMNDHPGLLVVSQIFYPGWVAVVDGKDNPLVRADYTLVAVPLNAGSHTVSLVFRPQSFRIGLAISIASCALMAILLVLRFRARRQSRTEMGSHHL
jgi:hypothetical protein